MVARWGEAGFPPAEVRIPPRKYLRIRPFREYRPPHLYVRNPILAIPPLWPLALNGGKTGPARPISIYFSMAPDVSAWPIRCNSATRHVMTSKSATYRADISGPHLYHERLVLGRPSLFSTGISFFPRAHAMIREYRARRHLPALSYQLHLRVYRKS